MLALLILPHAAMALQSGQYESAKFPMVAVYPRPDGETATWARHRMAYADGSTQYSIPVAVTGGAYPYYYELLTAPSGMVVQNDWNSTNYGVITWTPTGTASSVPVTIRVTDQTGTYVDLSWTIKATISTSDFIFLDPSVSASGDGSKASPLKTFADVHKNSITDSTYSGRILYFRTGTHTLSGPETNGNLQLQSNRKPAVWLEYPGDNAVVNCSSSKVLVDAQNDVFVGGGLSFTSARTDVNNAHFWFFNQNDSQDRMTFFNASFSNIGRGLVGSDNPAAITFFNPGSLRNYYTLWGCTLDDYSSPLTDAYAIKYGVVENNQLFTGKSSSLSQGIFLKSDIQYFSVRRNKSLTQAFGEGGIEALLQSQLFPNDNIEIAYNTILCSLNSNKAIVYKWTASKGANGIPNIWVYRNTTKGRHQGLDAFPITVNVNKNVVVTDQTSFPQPWSTPPVYITVNGAGTNLFSTTGLIDSSGNLLSTYASYLYLYGSAIAAFDGVPQEHECSPSDLGYCTTIGDCRDAGGYWYNDVCNIDEEVEVPVCDAAHPSLCLTEGACEGTTPALNWCSGDCQADPCPTPSTRTIQQTAADHVIRQSATNIVRQ